MNWQNLKNIKKEIETPCGSISLHILFNEEGKIVKTFTHAGRNGQCLNVTMEAISRLISLLLENGVSVRKIARQLKGLTCEKRALGFLSCFDLIGKALLEAEKEIRKMKEKG